MTAPGHVNSRGFAANGKMQVFTEHSPGAATPPATREERAGDAAMPAQSHARVRGAGVGAGDAGWSELSSRTRPSMVGGTLGAGAAADAEEGGAFAAEREGAGAAARAAGMT